MIIDHNLDILCITEWGNDSDQEVIAALLPNGYALQQRARGSRGGGVAAVHRSELGIQLKDHDSVFESFELLTAW